MADDTIKTAIELLDKMTKEDVVRIKFRKRSNNEERIMRCTLNFEQIPKRAVPKSVSLKKILQLIKDHQILHVYDVEKEGWRSVPFDRAEWLETSDKKKFSIRGK